MKIKSATVLLLVLLSCPAFFSPEQALGQVSNAEPQTVTLMARKKTDDYDNYTKAAFSFKYGINGDEAAKITRNNWDLLYGNINIDGDKDWFIVTLVNGDRSRIRDLGESDWSDGVTIPALPACPDDDDSCTVLRFPSYSSGKTITDENKNIAKALVGHMYLVHKKDRNSDFYALFRVDELKPNESCTISWKIVPAPEE